MREPLLTEQPGGDVRTPGESYQGIFSRMSECIRLSQDGVQRQTEALTRESLNLYTRLNCLVIMEFSRSCKQVVYRIFFNARRTCAGGGYPSRSFQDEAADAAFAGQGFDIVCIWLSTCFTPQVLRVISLASSA